MPNLNDVFLSIMASFIGFGLVIGIAQAAFDFGGGRSLLLSSPVFAQSIGVAACPSGQVFKTDSTYDPDLGYCECPTNYVFQYPNNIGSDRGSCVSVTPNAVTARIPLVTGWNMVSLPLEPNKPQIGEVLASIKGKYSRVTSFSAGGATLYSPTLTQISTLKELHAGQGFMIHMYASATLVYEAVPSESSKFPTLNVGWNLVGPVGVGGSYQIANTLDDMKQYVVYTLKTNVSDPAAEASKVYYPTITAFLSTKGYWIKKLTDAEIAAKEVEAKKYLDTECIANAVEKRDNATLAGMDSHYTTLRNLVVVRARDLKNAWLQFSDRKARRAEIARVWNKYRTDIRYMQRQSSVLKTNTWKQFTIDRKACGTYATADDYTSAGVDSSLQMFAPSL